MAKGYNSHILDVTRIWAKSGEAVTSQHIAWCWKSSRILSASDVADLTQIYGRNIGKCAQDEEVADLLSLMKQRTLDEQADFFYWFRYWICYF